MKLIINTAQQRIGGPIQVALSFLNECKNHPTHEYHVFLCKKLKELIDKKEFPNNFIFYDFDFGIVSLRKTFRINRSLQAIERTIKPDAVITVVGPAYFNAKAPHIMGFNLPLYVYPESPYFQLISSLNRCKINLRKRFHFYFYKRDSDVIVVQTDDMNARVRKALNFQKVHTISNNHSAYYRNWKPFPNKLPPKNPNRIRLLTLSSYYIHKNLEIIPKINRILKQKGVDNVDFILTLREDDFKKRIEESGMNEVFNVGPVAPNECPSLYNECDMLFLPTLAESFSASYAEAMIMEKPIITTNLGFARSICQDAAIYFKPMDAENAAEQIIKLINDEELCKSLIENGKKRVRDFDSPEKRVEKFLHLCKLEVEKQN